MPATPKDMADDCMARARAVLAAANTNTPVDNDLVRMALVMGVAALDTYMHAIIRAELTKNSNAVPKALSKLDLRFSELAQLANNTVAAQQKGKKSRPWVQVKNALHRRLLTETFQSYDAVGKAMSMAGIAKGWSQVATALGCSAKDIKSRLGKIVHRRNQIVHEGDHRRLVRPQAVTHNQVVPADIQGDLDWLDQLIGAIDGLL